MPSPRPWPWRLPGVLTGLTGLTIVALLGGAPCAAAADRDPAAKTLTLNAALSNQTHRGLRPYQIALTRRFGAAFAQAHFVAEGRRACWSARAPPSAPTRAFTACTRAPTRCAAWTRPPTRA